MGAPLKLRESRIDFRRKHKHGLAKLLAGLTKESDDAVAVLVKCMTQTADVKLSFEAAKKLLDMRKECEVIINTDDIQRMLLESKNPDRSRDLVADDDDTPQIDFSNIQDGN